MALGQQDTANRTRVFFDESGQQLSRPVIVGAAVCEAPVEIERSLTELYEELSSDPRFEGMPSFEAFLGEGFHNGQIPWELETRMIQELSRMAGFRIYIAFTRRTRLAKISDDQRCLVLYAALLPDILLSLRGDRAEFIFERNNALDGKFAQLVEEASEVAARKNPYRKLAEIEVAITGKTEILSIGLVDFAMAIVSRWLERGMSRDVNDLGVRNLMALERNIAVLYDFDEGRRSTRLHREFR